MRRRGLAVAGAGAACAFAVAMAFASGRREAPSLGALVVAIEAPDDVAAFADRAIELTPPIQAPISDDGLSRIVVFLELPRGTELAASQHEGTWSLVVPPGALASRVEARAANQAAGGAQWRVLDVRQTAFGEPGAERFRLLRPRRGGGLTGISWLRGEASERQATDAIHRLFDADVLEAPETTTARAEAEARLVRLNGCPSCHVAWHAEDRRPGTLVQRATDAQGLYFLSAVFSDTGPFERYRARNPSAEDPFVHVRCEGADVPRRTTACADGTRPLGWLDLRAALAAGDAHAARVCDSRRALAERMNAAARRVFADVLDECAARG